MTVTALESLLVMEIGTSVAGSYAAKLFADYGSEVHVLGSDHTPSQTLFSTLRNMLATVTCQHKQMSSSSRPAQVLSILHWNPFARTKLFFELHPSRGQDHTPIGTQQIS